MLDSTGTSLQPAAEVEGGQRKDVRHVAKALDIRCCFLNS